MEVERFEKKDVDEEMRRQEHRRKVERGGGGVGKEKEVEGSGGGGKDACWSPLMSADRVK